MPTKSSNNPRKCRIISATDDCGNLGECNRQVELKSIDNGACSWRSGRRCVLIGGRPARRPIKKLTYAIDFRRNPTEPKATPKHR